MIAYPEFGISMDRQSRKCWQYLENELLNIKAYIWFIITHFFDNNQSFYTKSYITFCKSQSIVTFVFRCAFILNNYSIPIDKKSYEIISHSLFLLSIVSLLCLYLTIPTMTCYGQIFVIFKSFYFLLLSVNYICIT